MNNLKLINYDINGSKQIVNLIKRFNKMTKIIAELCQNHNGDLKILEEMVHSASSQEQTMQKYNQCYPKI